MANRGITLTRTTILGWVQSYLPEFEKRWRRLLPLTKHYRDPQPREKVSVKARATNTLSSTRGEARNRL
jgi:hypothetical protein